MNRVKDKVCIVTGGAKGIGQSACQLLAREGSKVAITDIDDDAGEKLAATLRDGGGEAAYWSLNVADESAVQRVFGEIYDRFSKIDVLVNNAGIAGVNKPTHEIVEDEWNRVIDINVKGVFLCTKHAIPYMKENGGGSIINLSSIYGIISAPDLPAYHASKGAVRLMAKTDALLYAGDNIRVNSIHPGYIWTPLVEELGRNSPEGVEAFRQELDSRHPIGHVGEPDDIGYGIVYLASDESKFLTGSELVIDGGYTCR